MEKCDKCDKPAVYNHQARHIVYEIDENGDYEEIDSQLGSYNEFYCDEHDY